MEASAVSHSVHEYNRSEHFENNFKGKDYLESYKYAAETGKFMTELEFLTKNTAEFIKSLDLKGHSFLDLGSGPTVFPIFPVAHRFDHIILSEYVADCRRELEKWLHMDNDALDWSLVHEAVASQLGYVDRVAGRQELENAVRKNVKSVIPCDYLSKYVVPKEYFQPYDMIMSSLSLEAAAPDYETYNLCVRKLNHLVKLGGRLLLRGLVNGENWKCGKYEFPCTKLTQSEVCLALTEAGFGHIQWKSIEKQDDHEYQFEAIFCLVCTKEKEIR